MLETNAIGDAWGAQFEFEPVETFRDENDKLLRLDLESIDLRPRANLKYSSIGEGKYTDDTQMAAAIALLILSGKEFTPENIASSFIDTYRSSPRKGYGKYTQESLDKSSESLDPVKFFLSRYGQSSVQKVSNGAAMRSVPIGVLTSPIQVLEAARLQSVVTHPYEEAVHSSQAVSLASHFFWHNLGDKDGLHSFLIEHMGVSADKFLQPWDHQDWCDVNPTNTVRAAFSAIMAHDNLVGILHQAVHGGGDVDTIAAIALGIAGHAKDITNNLPSELISSVEDNEFGISWLRSLDQQLLELFPRYE